MGYIKHEAIICISYNKEHIAKAHKKATALFGRLVSNVIDCNEHNSYYSFFISPDGSKEGWTPSDIEDYKRIKFKDYIHRGKLDESLFIDIVHVAFGGDLTKPEIIKS